MSGFVKAIALAAVLGAIGVVNVLMMREPVATSPINPMSTRQTQLPETGKDSGTPAALPADGLAFVQSFSRPLFAEDRRKYQPPVVQKPTPVAKAAARKKKPASPPPAISLLGVSITGGTAKALISANDGGSAEWRERGETIGDWEISGIDENNLILKQNDREAVFNLHPEKQ